MNGLDLIKCRLKEEISYIHKKIKFEKHMVDIDDIPSLYGVSSFVQVLVFKQKLRDYKLFLKILEHIESKNNRIEVPKMCYTCARFQRVYLYEYKSTKCECRVSSGVRNIYDVCDKWEPLEEKNE